MSNNRTSEIDDWNGTMVSSALAAALERRNIHYGWVIVAVTFLTTIVTAAALALRLMLFGLFGPFAAAFMNRFGVRAVMVSAVILISAGMLASLAMTQVWQLIVLWGIVVGIGTGLTAMVLAVTVATRWFNHRRGLVMGLFAASNATGQLVFLPLIAQITTAYGWRIALVCVCCMLAFAGVVAFTLMRDRPSDLGLPLYGESA